MSMQKDITEKTSAFHELCMKRSHHDNTNLYIITNPHSRFLKENFKLLKLKFFFISNFKARLLWLPAADFGSDKYRTFFFKAK